MFFLPDIATLRLCSMLASSAFAVVFVILWRGRRDEAQWLHWAVSSALYAGTLIGFHAFAIDPITGGILCGLVVASNLFVLSGARAFDGRAPFAAWMLLPVLATGLAFAIPKAGALPEAGDPSLVLRQVGGTLGLALSAALIGGLLIRDGRKAPSRGRLIAGFSLLGYLPGYAVAIVSDISGHAGMRMVALLPILSDQVLLGILNLGLLAMPGERAQAALRDAALRDALTGAWNRAGLAAHAPRLAAAGGSVIVLDVDHFKTLNDRFGHGVGDRILTTLTRCATLHLPGTDDAVVRLGGDEFVVVLAGRSLEQGRAFTDALRGALKAVPDLPPWTVSMGVARIDPRDTTLAEAIVGADRALYAAKAAGRDRAVA